jgi:hypothetical protein
MSSSEYQPLRRRRRTSRRVLRAFKLAAPFLLLIAVGLLSAGFIHFVETTAAPPIKSPLDEPAPVGEQWRPDPRQGWQGRSTVSGVGRGLQLGDTAGVLEGVLPTSFLEEQPSDRIDSIPQAGHGIEGPGARLLPVIEVPIEAIRPVPEPSSSILLAMGLGLLGIRRQTLPRAD